VTDDGRQRIDKWLWFARVVKTRALAQELAASGKVRLNGRKVDAASQAVRLGDVLTIGIAGRVRVLKVAGFAERRGSYPDALKLFEDMAPPPDAPAERDPDAEDAPAAAAPPAPAAPEPHRGEGRPTKRDRRRLDRIEDGDS
jgi:ribosome-associated heat shock protein Hsp15